MFERIEVLPWVLEVDREATAAGYRGDQSECLCLYCQNYRAANGSLPRELLELMERLGIEASKPAEIMEYMRNEDGSHLYGAMCNVVGRIISGPDIRQHVSPNAWSVVLEELTRGVKIGFAGEAVFRRGFADPLIQMEFEANLPWVLTEKP